MSFGAYFNTRDSNKNKIRLNYNSTNVTDFKVRKKNEKKKKAVNNSHAQKFFFTTKS